MPELPDIERFRRLVQDHLVGHLTRVEILDPSVLRNTSAVALHRDFGAARFTRADRYGKWLLLHSHGPVLVMHFGMTGSLAWWPGDHDRMPSDRLVFTADVGSGQLRYRDRRKLGGVWSVDDDAIESVTGPLGPDTLRLSLRHFRSALQGRRGAIKTVLIDQSMIAGLGNMLSDEILWRARLHPATPTASLGPDDVARLHRAIGAVLRPAVAAGEIPRARSWLRSRRDDPAPHCPRCRTGLEWSRIGGRSSIWCPRCQPPPG